MRKREDFDAIVIGAGHNGLTCAAYLARSGMRVKVLEARPVIGGAAVTEEFAPGYRNSSCSYVVSLLNPKVIQDLELTRHGLEVIPRPCDGFFPQPDGSHLIYGPDSRDFVRQLEARNPGDGAGYERLDADLNTLVPIFRELMLTTPPNLGGNLRDIVNAALTLKSARKLSLRERSLLIDIMTTSAADFLSRYFKDEAVKASFGYLAAVGSLVSPYAGGTAYILLDHVVGEANGVRGMWGHAKGGMGAISDAIAKSGAAHGISIETATPVKEIIVERGQVKGAVAQDGRTYRAPRVVSAIHPKLLFGKLLDPALIPKELTEDINDYVSVSGTFRMNVALDELPDFTALPGKSAALQHKGSIVICPSLRYMDNAYDDAKHGHWANEPIIEMCIPSTLDPTLAPPGKHVASLFCQHFHPYLSDGRDWDDHRDEVADLILKTVDRYAPNFSGTVTRATPLAQGSRTRLRLGRRLHLPWQLETQPGVFHAPGRRHRGLSRTP